MSETIFWALFALLILFGAALLYLTRKQQLLVSEQNQTIRSLTHLVASRDPMTYAALQQNTEAEVPEVYIPKNDEAEAAKWEELTGDDGTADYEDDLRDLGLSR